MNTFELLATVDALRLIPLLGVFLYAAIQDKRTGEVANYVWAYSLIGCPIMIIEYALYAANMWPLVLGTSLTCIIIALFLSKVKFGLGGADTAALITLGLCYPIGPAYSAWIPLYPMLAVGIGAAIAVIVMFVKKQKQLRFMPAFFVGLLIMALI